MHTHRPSCPTITFTLAALILDCACAGMPQEANTVEPESAVLPQDDPDLPTPEAPVPAEPRLLEPADYGKFEALRGGTLSENGHWFAYEINRVDKTRELHILSLADDTIEELTIPWANRATFSADGAWVAWSSSVSEAEAKRLREKKEPIRSDCVLRGLGNDDQREFLGVAQFSFDETGRFLALHGYPAKDADGKGADLRLLDLERDSELTLGNVDSFSWCEGAPLLAIAMKTGSDAGNGVQVVEVETNRVRNLDASKSEYSGLRWREDSSDLAVLRSVLGEEEEDEGGGDGDKKERKGEDEEETEYVALAWIDVENSSGAPRVLDPTAAGIEDDMLVSGFGGPRWSKDGSRISVGLKQRKEDAGDEEGEEPEAPDEVDEEETGEASTEKADPGKSKDKDLDLPGLQIWHSNDLHIYPQQKSSQGRSSSRTMTGVWHLESDRLVRVTEDLLNRHELLEGWDHALERDTAPYAWGQMFGRPYHDLWITDTETGERHLLLERVRYSWASTGGRYILSFDGTDYWVDDLIASSHVALTKHVEAQFGNTEYDTPTDLRPPYGVSGWLQDDAAVLLHDRFDVWQVALDGSGGTRLTRGAEDQRKHRLLDLDSDEPAHDRGKPMYFHFRGDWTERQGYSRLDPSEESAQPLLDLPKGVGGLSKAKEADVYVFRVGARDDSPDWFTSDADLTQPRQVSSTNDFIDEFHWTRAELVEWTSDAGVPLQGCLLYPANHDPSVRAPMIVYTYEKLSQELHRWRGPSDTDYYNQVVWTQAGYFVLLPDIVYRAREPGPSALDAVRPAVAKVVELGLVDPERVGLIGHSWGGYQAAFLPTRTDIFAASVAGAPLTDFVSFMGQIHWAGGIPETSHWETGQGRMEVPYWEDPEAHRRSSPMERVHELNTPILMTFGDEDGAVDWDQGTQFYNYARRAGKQMVLLVYEGEGHGLRQDANRRDYHRRILEWFGHYLKGDPAPAWITDGVKLDDLEDERKRLADPED